MLALFFALGASWAHLAHLAAFVVALGCFLKVLDRSGVDFGEFQESLGGVLEVPGRYFSSFFCGSPSCVFLSASFRLKKPSSLSNFFDFCRFFVPSEKKR